jgi:hypothetical protein
MHMGVQSAVPGDLQCRRPDGHNLPLRESFVQPYGDVHRVGHDLARVRIANCWQRILAFARGIVRRGWRANIEAERLDVWVVHPDRPIRNPLVVQSVPTYAMCAQP